MAGPSIAAASITVDLDGKKIPAEARALGHEAGAAAGEEHNKAFDEELQRGYGDTRKEFIGNMREGGTLAGDKSGNEFTAAFKRSLRNQAGEVNQQLVDIFSKNDGLDVFHRGLQNSDDEMKDIEATVGRVNELLLGASENGSLNKQQFHDLAQEATDWGDNTKAAVRDIRSELDKMFTGNGSLEGYRRNLQGLRGDFVPVEEVVRKARGVLDEFSTTTGQTQGHVSLLRTELDKFAATAEKGVVNEAGRIVRSVDNIGREAEKTAKKADNLGSKLAQALGGVVNSAGGGNIVAIIGLIAGVAGPAAALVGALAAQTVILGAVAAAAGVGLLGLYLAFSGLFGKDAKNAPAALQPTIKALGDLGGAAKQLKTEFQLSVFTGLGPVFDHLADTLPKFGAGVTSIGGALKTFLTDLSDGITKNVGPINSLLEGFAPIIVSIGSAVINLIGVFGGLFKAAMPFAQDFASSLAGTIKSWSDWINSIAGQKELQKWFAEAQPVLDHVMTLLGSVATSFGNLVTPQTKADVLLVLDGVGAALEGLTPLLAALSPVVGAAGQLLGVLGGFVATLAPVAAGVAAIVSAVVQLIDPVIQGLGQLLTPVFSAIGGALTTIGQLVLAASPVVQGYLAGLFAAAAPIVKVITDIYQAFVDFYQKAIVVVSPALQQLGTIFQLVGSAVGDMLSGLFGAIGQMKLFGDASSVSGGLLDGLKGVMVGVSGFLGDIAAAIKNDVIPAIKELDWKKVTKGLDEIVSAVPAVVDAFIAIGTALGADIDAVGAWAKLLIGSVGDVIKVFGDVSKVVQDVLSGNFVAAAADGAKAFADVSSASGDLAANVKDAMDKTQAAIDKTNDAQKRLKDDAGIVSGKIKSAFKDFSEAGDGNLKGLASRMGLTGDAATAFRQGVEDAAKKSGVSLDTLAGTKSLKDLETKLGITGTAAKTKFEALLVDSSNVSGAALDKLPPKAQAIIGKLLTLDGLHVTPSIKLTGSELALQQASDVAQRLKDLNASSATVTIITKQVASGTAGGALGGVISGGQYVEGGRAFAAGGLLSTPTWFGNALAGESGVEAIVPLSKPLYQVDPSVRNLSAFAQGLGMNATSNKPGAYVAPGAIQVITPSENPSIVAEQVMDRLVPQL